MSFIRVLPTFFFLLGSKNSKRKKKNYPEIENYCKICEKTNIILKSQRVNVLTNRTYF